VAILGPSAREAPPGTDTINRLIAKVDGPVLLLFDELLNLFSRHRGLAAGCFENLDFSKPENQGVVKAARSVAKKFADWCFERRTQFAAGVDRCGHPHPRLSRRERDKG
jgi:hypothetical protein